MRYKESGVNIDEGNAFVEDIKPLVKETENAGCIGALGGFGGLYDTKAAGFTDPVLVAATDGVGTKLLLAREAGRHDGVGVDLVAMCVNDLLAQGAKPLFFLDYFATGKLDRREAAEVVKGICRGCKQAGAALIGGETAEMPGMYAPGHYDLAGFAVGAAERGTLLPHATAPGDCLIALSSSGVHSNGFSLVRRILEEQQIDLHAPDYLDGTSAADIYLEPTVIYEPYVRPLIDAHLIKAVSHITGGGVTENLPRVLSKGCGALIDASALQPQPLFKLLAEQGGIDQDDMLRTFNCGAGLILVCDAEKKDDALAALQTSAADLAPRVIGEITAGEEVAYTGGLFG